MKRSQLQDRANDLRKLSATSAKMAADLSHNSADATRARNAGRSGAVIGRDHVTPARFWRL
jgi:hypothetical protein